MYVIKRGFNGNFLHWISEKDKMNNIWEGIIMKNSKKFKRIVSLSAAAMCFFAGLRFAPISDEEALAADSLTAFEITEEMKIGWNIGNSLDATSGATNPGLSTETAWGNPKITQELIDAVKAKGFNTIRIPTTWYQHLDEENNIDAQWLARVHEVVDYCYNNDMYVILNLHHEDWVNRADLGTAYDEMSPKLLKIWQQIADEFTDYDQHLIFECMNEPRAVGTDHEWWGPQQNEVDTINQLNADFVELIRNDDSPYADTRLLMIPGYCAASDVSMISKIVVPEDEYVAISIHAYVPYNFTMNAEVTDHSTFTEAYATELESILEGIRETFIEKDVPVVIGEFGTSNYDNTDARCEWAEAYITKTKTIGVPCVLWDNNTITNTKDPGECHGYINRTTLEWYEVSEPVVDTMMSVLADESISWGSNTQGIQYDHEDIDSGTTLLDTPVELDSALAATSGNCTAGLNATWAQLEGGDVAVQFTGDVPVIAVVDGAWDNWTEIKHYDVDDENGIAYYSAEHIAAAWSGDVSEIEHLFARTNSTTTVTKIAIIGATNTDIETTTEDKTEKYSVDLSGADRTGTLVLNFEGTVGAETNGCVGYTGTDGWTSITWEGFIGEDGKLKIEIPLADIPESVKSAEAQIWWGMDDVDMVDYEIVTGSTTTDAPSANYGDANGNGDVEVADAVYILQGIADPSNEEYILTEENKVNANCNDPENTGVDAQDALAIQMFMADMIASLPVYPS